MLRSHAPSALLGATRLHTWSVLPDAHVTLSEYTFPLSLYPSKMTFAVGVRDSLMIAHSFTGEEFGPAQQVRFAAPLLADLRGDVRLDHQPSSL